MPWFATGPQVKLKAPVVASRAMVNVLVVDGEVTVSVQPLNVAPWDAAALRKRSSPPSGSSSRSPPASPA